MQPSSAREIAAYVLDAFDATSVLRHAGMDADEWQAELLLGEDRRVLLNCSRQSGKSTAVAAAAVHLAIFQPGSLAVLVSASLKQAGELLRTVLRLYRVQPDAPKIVAESQAAVELANGSRIISAPAVDEGLRGYSPDLLVLDEAACLEPEVFTAARPMLAAKPRGRMILLSTPRGRRGFFAELWHGEGDWKRIRVSADQCSRISKEWLESERSTLGPVAFKQEYFCEFAAEGGESVFSYDDILAAVSRDVKPLEFRRQDAPVL